MRLPRMTTRRWMVAIAAAGLLCLLEHRRRAFESLAAYHRSKVIHVDRYFKSTAIDGTGVSHTTEFWRDSQGKDLTGAEAKESDWHAALAEQYRTAAAQPWLPVRPDPPPPAP
jgi:hypothetical protein